MRRVLNRALAATTIGISLVFTGAAGALAVTGVNGFSATTYVTGYPVGAPAGVAFIGTTMYTANPADGGLYSTTTAGSLVKIGTIPGTPTGLAAFGTSLFAIQSVTNTVVRVNPATAAVTSLGMSFAGLRLNGIATDPVNGDLFLSAEEGYVQVIRAPYTGGPAFLIQLNGSPRTFGIAVATDHAIYLGVEGGGVSGVRQIQQPSLSQGPIGASFTGARGIGVIPGYLFVNNADGTIRKIVIPGVGVGSDVPNTVTGGAAGSFATIGASLDGCFYASQGPAVIRLTNLDGTCNLASAAPPAPPPAITLTHLSTQPPLIGNGDQTFSARISNATPLEGIAVTFTVTRDAIVTTYARVTDTTGTATFGYAAATPGTDIITASAIVNATTLTSVPYTLFWPRALDAVAPVITYTVTGGHNPNPPAPAKPVFSCPDPILGTPGSVEYCGWYTSPPTVRFTVGPGAGGTTPVSYRCPDFTLTVSSPLSGTPVTCTAQNGDGKSSALKVVLQAALSAPTITAAASTVAGPYSGARPTNQDVTVSFTCATDQILGPAGIISCGPTQTVTAEGPHTISGGLLDVAGTRKTATFPPFIIDKTPPTVTLTSMTTATDGLPYVAGTPTAQDVIVTFACTDNLDPSPICPAKLRVTSSRIVIASATDWAGNTKAYSFGQVVIDRTPPTVTAVVTPVPDAGGFNTLTATVTVTATDPSGVGSITYSATGAQPIAARSVPAAVNLTTFSVPIVLNVAGTTTVTYSAMDKLGNVSASGAVTVKIVSRQPSTLTITSLPSLPQGATTVMAKLVGPGGLAIVGRTVTFAAGTVTATGVTNASGIASATLALKPGRYSLHAAFTGDGAYLPSSADVVLVVTATSNDQDNKDIQNGNDVNGSTGENSAAIPAPVGTTRASLRNARRISAWVWEWA